MRRLQQSTSTQKAIIIALTTGPENKVFDFVKQKYAADFLNNVESIVKQIAVNYKQGGTKMNTAINNTKKQTINIPEVP